MAQPIPLLDPQLSLKPGHRAVCGGLAGAAAGLLAARLAAHHDGPLLAVVSDPLVAQRLEEELRFYAPKALHGAIHTFPDHETLPYDLFSPYQDIISDRLTVLARLPTMQHGIVIVPVATLMQRLPPRDHLERHSLLLDTGQHFDLEATRARLEQAGYRCVSQVLEHGEFAVRGSLLDIFPMGSETPYRIELFDDEIESIRTFDPESQRSAEKIAQVRLLPAREFPLDEAAITRFRQNWRATFEGDPRRATVYAEVSEGNAPGGIEFYLPLFFETTATLFDYLPAQSAVLLLDGVGEAAEGFWHDCRERWEQRRHDAERPILPPEQLFQAPEPLFATLNRLAQLRLRSDAGDGLSAACEPPPTLPIDARSEQPAAALEQFIGNFPGRVLIAAESAGRRESLLELLGRHRLHPQPVEDWETFASGDTALAITVAPLEHGLLLSEPPLAVIAEAQLFGEQVMQRRRRSEERPSRDTDAIVRSLAELEVGAPVVHEAHGVGRYVGLQTLEAGGVTAEYLTLEYDRGDKLYVPVAMLHQISRYTGAAPESAPLHRLGSGQWERARKKAAERARDVAAELLDIYARREARGRDAFGFDSEAYRAFAAAFPFEETPDQRDAINAILADLQGKRPMDRLVCGDVGFGKTEVAMRAAFVAAHAGRQVAVLVPTTLLARQHAENFRDRFADWPLRIESLSRFSGKKGVDGVLDGLAQGTVDIVIATHKLLSESVRFKRLGLVIIDEEHRFGVRQKERLKALRAEVDVLTLTATPIPRTLNLSLSGLRDLSVIATPPARRLAVKTFVHEHDPAVVREACLREIRRGGQVYYLHNDVASIGRTADALRELLPEARIEVAHGQMRERELERIMSDFYHQRFHILVCTTIIESGIDIPSANTILIDRADKLGLAQLYQLRGRVGRSHHRAWAYLFVPSRKAMTPDAVKRLDAIASIEALGAGFTLATHDLEIRGAGELLGEEQSGQMHEVGFDLYADLLERAVKALREGRQPELERPLEHGCEVDLRLSALIPDDYLPDVHTRLVLYKRIASATDAEALRELQVEMIDRFGLLPPPVKQLFEITQLKLAAVRFGIRKLELGEAGGRLLFDERPNVDPLSVIELVQQQPATYRMEGGDRLRITAALPEAAQRIAFAEKLLAALRRGDD